MSLLFSRGELDDMRDVQEAHMMDTCLIAEPTKTTNESNLPVASYDWDEAEQSICGFDPSPSQELLDQVPNSEAVNRMPIDTVISNEAYIRITKRFGETIDPLTYQVIGSPRRGPSGLLVWLVSVTDGSDG